MAVMVTGVPITVEEPGAVEAVTDPHIKGFSVYQMSAESS